MLKPDLVSRQPQNQVIVGMPVLALAQVMFGALVMFRNVGLKGAAAPVRVERRKSDRAHRVWNRCCGCAC